MWVSAAGVLFAASAAHNREALRCYRTGLPESAARENARADVLLRRADLMLANLLRRQP